jgi:hypothetical protein
MNTFAHPSGPLLYRLKLEHILEPGSTDRIVALARVQARKTR